MAYTITEDCINCDACRPECPTESVRVGEDTYEIDANTCVECTQDSQCPRGKHCNANACVAAAECERDDDCGDGKVCQAGKCKACAPKARAKSARSLMPNDC